MLLFSRPPYLRWVAAVAVVVAALAWDVSKRSTEPYPFAASPIPAGTALSDDLVEWRDLPVGSIERPDIAATTALVDIASGDPITSSVAGRPPSIPDGWWAVAVRLPPHLIVGSEVRLILPDGRPVDAVVSTGADVDQYGYESIGAVAVPPELADAVAAASSVDAVIVLAKP